MITVKDLSYCYPTSTQPALKDVSFSVESGEIFGFLGPSGSGKSTLQKILTGALTNYQGEVHVFGASLEANMSDYHERIGVDFEIQNFYGKFTARENLTLFSSLYRRKSLDPERLLEQVGLIGDIDKRVNSFSKGMRTRLGFVRCLLHDPDLIFLDEPTSGLDPANSRIMKDMIRELQAAGKTIILTTHNMHDAAELCTKVAFIVKGEIQAIDSPSAFMRSSDEVKVRLRLKNDTHNEEEITIGMSDLGYDEVFIHALRNQNILSIHSQEPSLEDAFISLTGRRLD